ncbi:hypothetical protein EVAR_5299_1 [Eumeta japonica]|uniref:Uncharacterized protein n=1 Tax=Eumeta variegata TaxID=151549 RepID=A0A4C1TNN6_EUMVA|nr:hypothetical protein EVAR_5299_1 [Eumeta japonica]
MVFSDIEPGPYNKTGAAICHVIGPLKNYRENDYRYPSAKLKYCITRLTRRVHVTFQPRGTRFHPLTTCELNNEQFELDNNTRSAPRGHVNPSAPAVLSALRPAPS